MPSSQWVEQVPGGGPSLAIGRLVDDGAGYLLAITGEATAVLVADGAGLRVAAGVEAARILGFGNSFIVRTV
jgi:hypothetical protein